MNSKPIPSDIDRIVGYKVEDAGGVPLGHLHNYWSDEHGQPLLLGVKTGWIFGKNHVVPIGSATIDDERRRVRIHYAHEVVRRAPAFEQDAEIDDAEQDRIARYFGFNGGLPAHPAPASVLEETMETGTPPATSGPENVTLPLHQEEMRVGKRVIEDGGVRVRKVIRTEIVHQPVEIQREDIVVERIPAKPADDPAKSP
jgi:hypothetical protein